MTAIHLTEHARKRLLLAHAEERDRLGIPKPFALHRVGVSSADALERGTALIWNADHDQIRVLTGDPSLRLALEQHCFIMEGFRKV